MPRLSRAGATAALALGVAFGVVGCSASEREDARAPGNAADAAARTASQTPPRPYVYRDGGIEARFFTTPEIDRREGIVADGMYLTATRVAASDDHHAEILTRLELTGAGSYDCDGALEGIVDRTLADLGCLPIQRTSTTLVGVPARDVAFRCEPVPMRGALRVVCDNRQIGDGTVRAYALLSAYDTDRWDPKASRSFFDALVISPPGK
jgi:hypothetical protein